MRAWSDKPSIGDFGVRFFLDTNLLVYLIDNTYPSINSFVEILNDSQFAEIVSSKYVLFEFMGVRKREHYLRSAADRSLKLPSGKINFSSLLKYKDSYSIPNASYEDLASDIQKNVNEEIEKLATEFKINYEFSSLHADQLTPTFDVCLSSKISNQDSLVLISSVLTQKDVTHKNVMLVTNDSEFVSSYNSASVNTILSKHLIDTPAICNITNFSTSDGSNINLTTAISKENLTKRINHKILDLLRHRLNSNFLGQTFIPKTTLPQGIICFKLKENVPIKNGMYVTIVSKNLDFIYTSRKPISDFRHSNTQLSDGDVADNDRNISFKIMDVNDAGEEIEVGAEIMAGLREDANILFLSN